MEPWADHMDNVILYGICVVTQAKLSALSSLCDAVYIFIAGDAGSCGVPLYIWYVCSSAVSGGDKLCAGAAGRRVKLTPM